MVGPQRQPRQRPQASGGPIRPGSLVDPSVALAFAAASFASPYGRCRPRRAREVAPHNANSPTPNPANSITLISRVPGPSPVTGMPAGRTTVGVTIGVPTAAPPELVGETLAA